MIGITYSESGSFRPLDLLLLADTRTFVKDDTDFSLKDQFRIYFSKVNTSSSYHLLKTLYVCLCMFVLQCTCGDPSPTLRSWFSPSTTCVLPCGLNGPRYLILSLSPLSLSPNFPSSPFLLFETRCYVAKADLKLECS